MSKRFHYHLIGIGGIGMGTLASLLLAKGHKVSGSDVKDSDYVAQLRKAGAQITIGHHASNIRKPNFVVYSSAVRVNNPERIEAESQNIPVLKRAQVLATLVNEQTGITVAGAHGKTTTTSMISYLLINAGLKPTTAVGGIINGTSYNAHLGEGKYFVAEVDESDGTFLYFQPHFSIITNIDFEHVDHYKNWDGIIDAYTRFIGNTAMNGAVIACGEDARLTALTKNAQCKVLLYGGDDRFDFYAQNIQSRGFHTSFDCMTPKGMIGQFELIVPGRHNVLNALACIALGVQLGIPIQTIRKTLKEFSGVKRRFQLKGQVDDIMVVDDYGHHPTEVAAVLKTARLFEPKRLVTVFQPHRYSRTKFLLDEFVQSLSNTDHLILTDIYAASEKESEGVGTKVLFDRLAANMGKAVTYVKKEDIVTFVKGFAAAGDMVLFLGAGDIYHFSDELVDVLKQKKVGV